MISFVKDFWSEGWVARGTMVFVVLFIVAIPFGVYGAVQQHHKWVEWCHEEGGHVIDHTSYSTGTTYNNGKPTTTTTSETTYYCLNEEGGIIDIE